MILRNTPRIDLMFVWNYWAFEITPRFNSGRPYTSYRFGPIFIRKFWK